MSVGIGLKPFYFSPDISRWQINARVDDALNSRATRLHQVVRAAQIGEDDHGVLSLSGVSGDATAGQRYGILGWVSEAGVIRNLGRSGAEEGPASIRQALVNIPFPFADQVYDVGDLHLATDTDETDLAMAQTVLGAAVSLLQSQGLFPIVLGGGNDLSHGHYVGLSEFLRRQNPPKRLGVINFDAHWDLRPLEERGISSGTPFFQIARYCRAQSLPFDYLCIGLQRAANTQLLFDIAQKLGALSVFADEFMERNIFDIENTVFGFLRNLDAVYLTVDLDVFHAGSAPGVSAVNPDGVVPGPLFYHFFDRILGTGKVVGFDVAEMSPKNDAADGRTAKLAARLVHRVIENRAGLPVFPTSA